MAPPDSARGHVRQVKPGLVLEGRWKILSEPPVFEDENYTIFCGRDVQQSTRVAIKTYKETDVVTWKKFRRSIDFQLTLRSRFTEEGGRLEPSPPLERLLDDVKARMSTADFTAARNFLTKMNLRECFVELISFSHDSEWNPALDPETGIFFTILEYSPEAISLQQRLDNCRTTKEPLSLEEVLQIQWALLAMVLGLNGEGLVHLELDLTRIVALPKRGKTLWKLMDFDPILWAGTHVRPQELPCYEWYAPPEIAKVFLRGPRDGERLAISPSLNVFNAGMCALDVATYLPSHDSSGLPWRLQWEEKHPDKSPIALAGENSVRATTSLPVIPQECLELLRRSSMDLGRLLEAMLNRNPEKRILVGQCVMHPWFEPKRSAIFHAKWSMPEDPPVPGSLEAGASKSFGGAAAAAAGVEGGAGSASAFASASASASSSPGQAHSEREGAGAGAAAAAARDAAPLRRPNQTFDEKEDLPITFQDLRAYIKAQIALGEEERAAEEKGAPRGFPRGKSLQIHGAAIATGLAPDVEVAIDVSPSAAPAGSSGKDPKEAKGEKKQGCAVQ